MIARRHAAADHVKNLAYALLPCHQQRVPDLSNCELTILDLHTQDGRPIRIPTIKIGYIPARCISFVDVPRLNVLEQSESRADRIKERRGDRL